LLLFVVVFSCFYCYGLCLIQIKIYLFIDIRQSRILCRFASTEKELSGTLWVTADS